MVGRFGYLLAKVRALFLIVFYYNDLQLHYDDYVQIVHSVMIQGTNPHSGAQEEALTH